MYFQTSDIAYINISCCLVKCFSCIIIFITMFMSFSDDLVIKRYCTFYFLNVYFYFSGFLGTEYLENRNGIHQDLFFYQTHFLADTVKQKYVRYNCKK